MAEFFRSNFHQDQTDSIPVIETLSSCILSRPPAVLRTPESVIRTGSVDCKIPPLTSSNGGRDWPPYDSDDSLPTVITSQGRDWPPYTTINDSSDWPRRAGVELQEIAAGVLTGAIDGLLDPRGHQIRRAEAAFDREFQTDYGSLRRLLDSDYQCVMNDAIRLGHAILENDPTTIDRLYRKYGDEGSRLDDIVAAANRGLRHSGIQIDHQCIVPFSGPAIYNLCISDSQSGTRVFNSKGQWSVYGTDASSLEALEQMSQHAVRNMLKPVMRSCF